MAHTGEVFAKGRVAFVTGAASGIGKAVCKACATRGMRVVLADFDAEGLRTAEQEVQALGVETLAVTMDVTKTEDWARARDATLAKFGEVGFFHNNAGSAPFTNAKLWEISSSSWEKTLDLNLHGVLHGIRIMVPVMLASNRPGCIVNTASGSGLYNGETG